MDAKRLVATADRYVGSRQRICGNTRVLEDLLGDDGGAVQCLGHVLKPCCDIDRVAERSEYRRLAKANSPVDDRAAMDADAKLDRMLQFRCEFVVHVFDVRADQRGSAQRLP